MNRILQRIWDHHWDRAMAGDMDSIGVCMRLLDLRRLELGL